MVLLIGSVIHVGVGGRIHPVLLGVSRIERLLILDRLLNLLAELGNMLQLLNGGMMALQCSLNDLCRSLLPLGQLLKLLGVLLLLLQ